MIKGTRNQLANVHNHYQTNIKRVLCVCSAGLLRSPTAANILHKYHGYNTRSAGSCEDFALIPVTEALLEWADEVVFVNRDNFDDMDAEQRAKLELCTVYILDIPDEHNWGHPYLEEIILKQYNAAKPHEM